MTGARTRIPWEWGTMAFLSLAMVLLASRYLSFDPNVYFPQQRAVYIAHTAALIAHIVGGMMALLFGPPQFLRRLRDRAPAVHRWSGRLYLAGVAIGGVGGLVMASMAYGGPAARLGFAALAVAWLFTTFTALRRILQRDITAHKRWMVRSFALTFAAVLLRLWLPGLTAAGLAFEVAYPAVAWLCWVPNLVVAEVGLRRAWKVDGVPAARIDPA